jgi:small subunit ribosomal protein S8
MMTDPIADMLTRIRNAVRIERTILDMPSSKLRKGVAQVLKDEGYVWDFEEIDTVPAKTLRLHLKYGPNGERLITRIDRVSKPGRRVYSGYKDLKPILGGMGIQILSTPRGVISDRRARAEKVGGEVLALIQRPRPTTGEIGPAASLSLRMLVPCPVSAASRCPCRPT